MKLKLNPRKRYPIMRDGDEVGYVQFFKDEMGCLRLHVEQYLEISSVDHRVVTRKEGYQLAVDLDGSYH